MNDQTRISELWHIEGRVQGVGYRAFTTSKAKEFGLDGWVRNRTDNKVEALIAGTKADLDALYDACMDGPPAANVEKITRTPAEDMPKEGFYSVPSA